jgi:hypothetical protein
MMRIDELDLVVELIEIEPMTFHAMGLRMITLTLDRDCGG